MNAIEKLKQVNLVKFPVMPLIEPHVNRILSESQLTRIDTVFDTKNDSWYCYTIIYVEISGGQMIEFVRRDLWFHECSIKYR
jgi:hypothetical protein